VLKAVTTLKTLRLPTGRATPALGQGTVRMGDDPDKPRDEVAALRLGLDLGLALIDTAECMRMAAPSRWLAKPSRAAATRSSSTARC
jgi:aryl-alcohol dehydrogenase-like predicted oxidoreductase